MGQPAWTHRPPPVPGPHVTAVWHGQPGTPAELTRMRGWLRAALADGGLPAGADDGERLLLAVEELTSNGLRHGRPPVQVTVTAAGLGWLLEVSDTASARPPTPAVGRDASLGGMGLGLVARVSSAHGWAVHGDRKIVWADIPYRTADSPVPERVRTATVRARSLVGCLAVREARIAATQQRLALDATREGRRERARAHRAAAVHARMRSERARLMSLAPPAASGLNVPRPIQRAGAQHVRPGPEAPIGLAPLTCALRGDRS